MDLRTVALLLLAWCTLCSTTYGDCMQNKNWCDCLQNSCGWCRKAGFDKSRCDSVNELLDKGCDISEIVSDRYYLDAACKTGRDSTDICSNRGTCDCGRCRCNERENPEEMIYGTYCECDNFSCNRKNGLLCSGRGACNCGKCACSPGWYGSDCSSSVFIPLKSTVSPVLPSCPQTTETCLPRSGDLRAYVLSSFQKKQALCSNKGRCVCGECQCKQGYTGQFCEECSKCESKCKYYAPCVQCLVFKSGRHSDPDRCRRYCGYIDVTAARQVAPFGNLEQLCVTKDDDWCTLAFVHGYDFGTRKYFIRAKSTRECPNEEQEPEVPACSVENPDVCGIAGKCDEQTSKCVCNEGYSGKYCENCETSKCLNKCSEYKLCVECKYRGSFEGYPENCREKCKSVWIAGINKDDYRKTLRNVGRCMYVSRRGETTRFAFTVDERTIYVENETPDVAIEYYPEDGRATVGRRKCSPAEEMSKGERGRDCGIILGDHDLYPELCNPYGHCDRSSWQCACMDGYFGRYCEDCSTEQCQGHCNGYRTCVECKYLHLDLIPKDDCAVQCERVSIVGIDSEDYKKPLPKNSRRCLYVDDWGRTVRFAYTVDPKTRDPLVRVEASGTSRPSDVIVDPDCDVEEEEVVKGPEDITLPENKPEQPSNDETDLKQELETPIRKKKPSDSGVAHHLIPSLMLLLLGLGMGAVLMHYDDVLYCCADDFIQ